MFTSAIRTIARLSRTARTFYSAYRYTSLLPKSNYILRTTAAHRQSLSLFHQFSSHQAAAFHFDAPLYEKCLSERAFASRTPYTGRWRLQTISKVDEIEIGDEAYQDFLSENAHLVLCDEHPKAQRVNEIGCRLAQATTFDTFNWRFVVVDDQEIRNACAVPGGGIAIYSGLLDNLQDDEHVAFILAHEMAHVLCEHGAENLSIFYVFHGMADTVQLLVSMLSPVRKLKYFASYFVHFILQIFIGLPISRLSELEADKVALNIMNTASYDPSASISWFTAEKEYEDENQLQYDENDDLSFILDLFESLIRTHPTWNKRIRSAQKHLTLMNSS